MTRHTLRWHLADLIRRLSPCGRTGTGSGRGGATGTPSHDLDEAPPSLDQEANSAVSGGGMIGPDGQEPRRQAQQSR